MSGYTFWAGTPDAIEAALAELDSVEDLKIISHGSVNLGSVERWCGIAAPPGEADHVIFDPPIEGDGSATWREYRHQSDLDSRIFAPECDVVFAVFRS